MARNQERASGGIYREHGPQGSRYLVYPRDSEVPQHTNVLPKLQMFVDSRYWSDVVIFFRAIPFLVEAPLALGDLMRGRSATVLASLTLLVLSLSSPAHAAGSGTGMTEHGSVTYTFSDIEYDGPSVLPMVRVSCSYAANPGPWWFSHWEVQFELRISGSNWGDTIYCNWAGGSTPDYASQVPVPMSADTKSPPIGVSGILRTGADTNRTLVESPVTPISLTVRRNPVQFKAPKTQRSSSGWRISGQAVATTPSRGAIGASGKLIAKMRAPGSKKWVTCTSACPTLDSFGRWRWSVAQGGAARPGTSWRVDLQCDDWCMSPRSVTGRLR